MVQEAQTQVTLIEPEVSKKSLKEIVAELRAKYPKLMYHLIPPLPLAELAYVYTMGAYKHAPNGWIEKPMQYDELIGRVFRHMERIRCGEMYCKQDGQMHAASIAWCGLTLCQYQLAGIGEDTRALYLLKGMEIEHL